MAEVTVGEAARILGVSLDTVRRRARLGLIQARRDEHGRYLVELPDEVAAEPESLAPDARLAQALETAALLREQNVGLQAQLDARTRAEEELRVLLLRQSEQLTIAQQQLQTLLPAPTEIRSEGNPEMPVPDAPGAELRPRRWRWPWQRG